MRPGESPSLGNKLALKATVRGRDRWPSFYSDYDGQISLGAAPVWRERANAKIRQYPFLGNSGSHREAGVGSRGRGGDI